MSSGAESGVTNNGQLGFQQQMAKEMAARNEENIKQHLSCLITNKFPNQPQKGKSYQFTIDNGRIITGNGINNANFIIDQNGKLYIGKGHSYLADGKSVKAAGTIQIDKNGNVKRITNLSGHCQPEVGEAINYPNILKNAGISVDKTWIDIFKFTSTKSGYVGKVETFYSGPVKYLRRRLK